MVKELNESITASGSMTTLTTMDGTSSGPPSAHAVLPGHHSLSAVCSSSAHTANMHSVFDSELFVEQDAQQDVVLSGARLAFDDADTPAPSIVRAPTEAALRQHNEIQVSELRSEAAAAAAAVLSRLAVDRSDGSESDGGHNCTTRMLGERVRSRLALHNGAIER